jgi:hypothetical protein
MYGKINGTVRTFSKITIKYKLDPNTILLKPDGMEYSKKLGLNYIISNIHYMNISVSSQLLLK